MFVEFSVIIIVRLLSCWITGHEKLLTFAAETKYLSVMATVTVWRQNGRDQQYYEKDAYNQAPDHKWSCHIHFSISCECLH